MEDLSFNPASFREARRTIREALCNVEDQVKSPTIVEVAKPLVAPTAFKCSDILINIGNERKEAYRFKADKDVPSLTSGGKTLPLTGAAYIVVDNKSGETHYCAGPPFTGEDPGILLFERKKNSMRFGLITRDGTELTWEDDTVFMFLGSAESENRGSWIVFAAGVGGANGFGGLVSGFDPNIQATAIGAFCALQSLLPKCETQAYEEVVDYEK